MNDPSPLTVLQAYLHALGTRDADAVADLASDHALVEIPMLRPNRLVGIDEIRKGHAAAFETLEDVSVFLTSHAESAGHAMADGVLRTKRASGQIETHKFGIVAQVDAGRLRRLSLYFDARNLRLWSDKTLM